VPEYYVVVKQRGELLKGKVRSVSMAMEQGVILLVAPGTEQDHWSVASNIGQEVELDKTGKLLNS
jgi:hypothetical protein